MEILNKRIKDVKTFDDYQNDFNKVIAKHNQAVQIHGINKQNLHKKIRTTKGKQIQVNASIDKHAIDVEKFKTALAQHNEIVAQNMKMISKEHEVLRESRTTIDAIEMELNKKIDEHQLDVETHIKTVLNHKKKVEKYHKMIKLGKTLNKYEVENKALKNQIKKNKKTIEKHEASHAEIKEKENGLKRETKKLKKIVDKYQEDVKKLDLQKIDVNQQFAALEDALDALQKFKNVHEAEKLKLEYDRKNQAENTAKYEAENKALKNQIKEHKKTIEKHESRHVEIKEKENTLKILVDAMENDYSAAMKRIDQKEKQNFLENQKHRKNLKDEQIKNEMIYNNQLYDLDMQKLDFEEKTEKLWEKVDEHQTDIKKHDIQKIDLVQQFAVLEDDAAAFEKYKNVHEAERMTLEYDRKSHAKIANSFQEHIEAHKNKLQKIQQKHNNNLEKANITLAEQIRKNSRNSKELEELKENHQDKLAHGQTVAQLQIEYDSLMKELLLQQETYTIVVDKHNSAIKKLDQKENYHNNQLYDLDIKQLEHQKKIQEHQEYVQKSNMKIDAEKMRLVLMRNATEQHMDLVNAEQKKAQAIIIQNKAKHDAEEYESSTFGKQRNKLKNDIESHNLNIQKHQEEVKKHKEHVKQIALEKMTLMEKVKILKALHEAKDSDLQQQEQLMNVRDKELNAKQHHYKGALYALQKSKVNHETGQLKLENDRKNHMKKIQEHKNHLRRSKEEIDFAKINAMKKIKEHTNHLRRLKEEIDVAKMNAMALHDAKEYHFYQQDKLMNARNEELKTETQRYQGVLATHKKFKDIYEAKQVKLQKDRKSHMKKINEQKDDLIRSKEEMDVAKMNSIALYDANKLHHTKLKEISKSYDVRSRNYRKKRKKLQGDEKNFKKQFEEFQILKDAHDFETKKSLEDFNEKKEKHNTREANLQKKHAEHARNIEKMKQVFNFTDIHADKASRHINEHLQIFQKEKEMYTTNIRDLEEQKEKNAQYKLAHKQTVTHLERKHNGLMHALYLQQENHKGHLKTIEEQKKKHAQDILAHEEKTTQFTIYKSNMVNDFKKTQYELNQSRTKIEGLYTELITIRKQKVIEKMQSETTHDKLMHDLYLQERAYEQITQETAGQMENVHKNQHKIMGELLVKINALQEIKENHQNDVKLFNISQKNLNKAIEKHGQSVSIHKFKEERLKKNIQSAESLSFDISNQAEDHKTEIKNENENLQNKHNVLTQKIENHKNDVFHFHEQKTSLMTNYETLTKKFQQQSIQLNKQRIAHKEDVETHEQQKKDLEKQKETHEKEVKKLNKKNRKYEKRNIILQRQITLRKSKTHF